MTIQAEAPSCNDKVWHESIEIENAFLI